MGKQFTIIEPYTRVIMPNGRTYDAGDTVVLTEAEYAQMTPGMTRASSSTSNVADPDLTPEADEEVVIESQTLDRLNNLGILAARASAGKAMIEHADATITTLDWANLTGAVVANNVQVASNRLHDNGTQPTVAYYAVGSAVITPGDRFTLTTSFEMVALGGSSAIYVGLSTRGLATTGSSASYPDDLMIGITTSGLIAQFRGANLSSPGQSTVNAFTVSAGRYIVSIVGEETSISFTIRKADDHTKTHTWRVAVSSLTSKTFGQMAFSIDDSRGTSGHGIGPVILQRSSVQTPRTKTVASVALEGSAHKDVVTASSGGDIWRVQIPANYDPRRPAPVCLYFHQAQSSTVAVDRPWANANEQPITKALGDAGYIVAAAQDGFTVGQNNDRYGNATSLAGWLAYYTWLRQHYAIGPIVLWGISAGCWPALNLLVRRTIPNIAAVYLHGGGFDISGVRAAGGTYETAIDTAYGSDSEATFEAATVDYNPALRQPEEFRGVPIRVSVVSDDTFGAPDATVDPYLDMLAPYAPEASKMTTATGGHLAAASFSSTDVMTFFNTHVPAP